MTTQPPFSFPNTQTPADLPTGSKLAAAGLFSIGFCHLAMLFLVWNQFQVFPVALSLLALGVGGFILQGKPWAPVLGTLYCLLFLLANCYFLDWWEEAKRASFLNLHLLLSPILLITFFTGLGATYQNYFSRA